MLSGCVGSFDLLANNILSNEVRFDDREYPHTAYAISPSSETSQILGGQGLGLSCSIPPLLSKLAFTKTTDQAPMSLQMRQACAFHDYCYRHGNATYGYSQSDCDFMLQQQAFRLCKFINVDASLTECETNARKVTLGVRAGGYGNFKQVRALKDDLASTFFEFDPYPTRSDTYSVVRIASTPDKWIKEDFYPKAAYIFDITPSGSKISIIGWNSKGAKVCNTFEIPSSYESINVPPMVVNSNNEDWFVWWKRNSLNKTTGNFALLPLTHATKNDWIHATGGLIQRSFENCDVKEIWDSSKSDSDTPNSDSLKAFKIENIDVEFSEIRPMHDNNTPNIIRLLGLTTHSCNDTDLSSLCIIDVELDTKTKKFKKDENVIDRKLTESPTKYRAVDKNLDRKGSNDRYRNLVASPFIISNHGVPALIWMRRGTGNGNGYETVANVRHHAIGETRDEISKDMGEKVLSDFSENAEPVAIMNESNIYPTFISILQEENTKKIKIETRKAVPLDTISKKLNLDCPTKNSQINRASLIYKPATLVKSNKDSKLYYLFFTEISHANFDFKTVLKENINFNGTLNIVVATISSEKCITLKEQSFPYLFSELATEKDKSDIYNALVDRDKCGSNRKKCTTAIKKAEEGYGKFLGSIRGAKTIFADLSGDKLVDFLFVTKTSLGNIESKLYKGKQKNHTIEFESFDRIN